MVTTLTKLCKEHQKRIPCRKRQFAPWWTSALVVQMSRLNALKRLFRRTTEPVQRGKLGLLFRHKSALYKRAILRVKHAHFRRFKTEELDMDRFSSRVMW